MAQDERNIHSLNERSETHSTTDGASDLTFEAVQQLVLETRASLDILTEMICLIYADGDKKIYDKTLQALRYRQKEAETRIRDNRSMFGSGSSDDTENAAARLK